MAKLLKLRRGTTSQHSSFTGAEGEVTVDTTKDTVVVHDGSTAGGIPLAKESALSAINTDLVNDTSPQLGGNLDVNTKNIILGDSSDGAADDVIKFGDGTDLKIYSDGTNGKFIGNIDFNGTLQFSDGSAADAMVWDQSTNNLEFKDGNKLTFGNGNDLQIWHEDTVGSHINNSHLKLYIDSYTGVVLEYNTAAKLETTNTGVTVTGTVVATAFTGTASLADTVTVTANNTTDETVYPLFVDGATGAQGAETDTGFTYNPSTGALTSTSFVGALTGNAATSTKFAATQLIGGVAFDGSGAINLPGVNTAGNQNTSGNAATATTSTNVTVADESSDTSCNVLFTTAATGDLPPKSGTNLTFNSSTGDLTATIITDGKGNVRSIPQNAQSTYTLVAADAGKHILATGTITIPNSVFSAGDAVTIVNNTGSNLTITKTITTMYNSADGTSANRTLATRGMATILFTSGTVAYISGSGLS